MATLRRMTDYFQAMAYRLRNVKIACGEWDRVLTPACTVQHGIVGALIDPPYSMAEHIIRYSGDTSDVAKSARDWCVEHGQDRQMRIAYCGYEGSVEFPEDWEVFRWSAAGGYGNQGEGRGRENAKRETIWFSPHCLKPELLEGKHEDSTSSIDDRFSQWREPEIDEMDEQPVIHQNELV